MLSFALLCRSRSFAALSLLSLLALLLLTSAARAGSWQVTYSDKGTGTWSFTSPSNTPPNQNGKWPAGTSGYGFGGSDTRNGNIQGTVTATLTWVPAVGSDHAVRPAS